MFYLIEAAIFLLDLSVPSIFLEYTAGFIRESIKIIDDEVEGIAYNG